MGAIVFYSIKWGISMKGFEFVTERNGQNSRPAIVSIGVVLIFVATMLGAIFSIIGEKNTVAFIGIVSVIAAGISYVIVRSKRGRVWRIGIALGIILILSGVLWKTMLSGLVVYFNLFLKLYNQFNETSHKMILVKSNLLAQGVSLFAFAMVISLLLMWILESRKGILGAVVLWSIPICVALAAGRFPSVIVSFVYIFAGFLYGMCYRNEGVGIKRQQMIPMLSMYMAICMTSLILQPLAVAYKEAHQIDYENIRSFLYNLGELDFFSSGALNPNFGGGISEGNLKGVKEFNPLGTKDLEVVLSHRPNKSVYLKAYVGGEYTGEKWVASKKNDLESVVGSFRSETKERSLMNEPFRRIQEGKNGLTEETIQIRIENANAKYAYTPYYVKITNKDEMVQDAYVKGEGKENRSFTYFSRDYVEYLDEDNLDEPFDLWKKYQSFVKKAYVNNYSKLEAIDSFCNSIRKDSADRVAFALSTKFQKEFKYSRTPGAMPKGDDFVEGFFHERKVGFCVHFATAATVVYQNCGIPARYVEGYLVSPRAFQEQSDGTYKAVVTDADAHAWCETFDPDLGWEIREHTIAYEGSEIKPVINSRPTEEDTPTDKPQDQPQQNANNENTPGEDEPKEEDDVDKPEQDEKNGAKRLWVPVVLVGVGLVIICVAIVVQQKIRRRKRFLSFRRKKDNRGIRNMYRAIYEMCLFAGILNGKENEKEWIYKIEETLLELTPKEWQKVYQYAEYAAFSSKTFTKEEQKEMYQLYCKFRKALLGTLRWYQRVWFLYGRAF